MERRNIFREQRQRTLAAMAAQAGALQIDQPSLNRQADGLGGIVPVASANNEAAVMLVKLTADRASLKQVKSDERKAEFKRQILPDYQAWLDGLIEGAESLVPGTRNDVLTTCMIWHIDAGDYARALHLGAIVIDREVPMPAWFKRSAPTAIAEEIANAALFAVSKRSEFDLDHVTSAMLITQNSDMHDEVRAKLFKAQAMLLNRKSETLAESGGQGADGVAGAYAASLESVLAAASRAFELDQNSGVKTLIREVERAQKKLATTASATSQDQTS